MKISNLRNQIKELSNRLDIEKSKLKRPNQLTADEKQEIDKKIVGWLKAGLSIRAIMAKTEDFGIKTYKEYVHKFSLKVKGDKQDKTRCSVLDLHRDEVVDMLNNGLTYGEIGSKYNVTGSAVSLWIRRREVCTQTQN